MSFQNAGQQVQKFINMYGNVDRTYQTINAIVDASNRNTSIRGIDTGWLTSPGGPGKLREVKITYFPMNCTTDGDCSTNLCDTGTIVAPKQVNYLISRCTASQIFAIAKDDLRYVDANWSFTNAGLEIIMHQMPNLRKALATQMLSVLSTYIGCQLNGAPYQQVSTSNPENAWINPLGKYQIERVFEDGGFTDKPFFLGNYEVDNWKKGVRIGGDNLGGQEIGELNADNMYYDALVDKTLGVNNGGNIIAFDPQVIKFLTFNYNAGLFRTTYNGFQDFNKLYWNGNDSFIEGMLYDPVTKLTWDLDATYDKCDKQWNFQIKLHWDIFQMPDISCNDYPCTNGIFQFKTCPQVVPDCPSENVVPYPTPASPVSPRTYTATPGLSYPFTLGQLNINGYVTTPSSGGNALVITDIADLVAAMNDNSQVVFTVSGSNITTPAFTAPSVTVNGAALNFS